MSNSLAKVHPELISEWSERNYPLTPDNITFGSNKIVWWKGSCGHEWQASVKSRSSGEKCPICSGKRVVAGINDLATLKPEFVNVDAVGKNAKKIEEYIRNQIQEDLEYDQMTLKEYVDPFTGEPVKKNN